MVGSCTGFCDQSSVAGGASGKKSNATNSAPVSRLPVRSCARTPCATRVSISCLRMVVEIRAGRQVDDLDPEPLRVEVDGHRRGELEGLRVDLRADVGDLADRNAAELDRRAGREPAHRFLEDEHEGLRIAGRQLEGSVRSLNSVKTVFASAGGRTGSRRRRLERDAADQDRQQRLRLHGEAARGERHVDAAGVPEARVRR